MPTPPSTLLRWAAADLASLKRDQLTTTADGLILTAGANQGTLTSAEINLTTPCDEVIMSWQGRAQGGSWIEFAIRAKVGTGAAARWTRWWVLGHWSEEGKLRQSVEGQEDADGQVLTDTLVLTKKASRLQWRATFHRGAAGQSPLLRGCDLATSPVPPVPDQSLIPVAPIPVPQYSQMVYPNGGPVWCSPTSLSMVLGFWWSYSNRPELKPFIDPQSVPTTTAPGVYDHVYDGTGNWSFNTAFAASLGLEAYVARLSGVGDLAHWLSQGVPVICSVRWKAGELEGAPVGHSAGHLIVAVGIDDHGNVVVNDPAADTRKGEPVRRVYRRDQFDRAWNGSGRAVYLVYPPNMR